MRTPISLALSLALLPVLASAQSTVNFSAGPDERNILSISSSALADGNYVAIGFFDTGFDVNGASSDLSALNTAWNEYGSTSITTIFGQPGRFADNTSTFDGQFDNRQIYLWIFETSDQSAPDAINWSNVSGYGLFTSSSNSWTFPAQGGLPLDASTTITSTEVDTALHGFFDGNSLMLQPVPVPEPGVLPLLLLGSVLLYGWTYRGLIKRD